MESIIDQYDLFILDMDGTIYLDIYPINGAIEFINKLKEKNKKYVFLTNNSSKSYVQYIEKLNNLGFFSTKENILTSGQACGMFLKEKKKNPICYVVGTSALKKELESYGVIICDEKVQSPDFLVVGYDTELEYKKLEKACQLLNENVPFIATNCDLVCPMGKESFLPDCGLFCHMLTVATKKQPYYIGKPNPDMINFLLNKYLIEKNKAIMIGDRIYTDIASGINAQINTALVLSGECTIEDLEKSNIKPTIVVQSVKDFL